MKYLSVCSGIEAASVAWHPLGWEPIGFSEVDPFASAVLSSRFPNVPNMGDMTKYAEWNLPAFDLLVGGTPCQSFSVAGLRKGLADPRGNLALVYLGILDRYRPRWCVWENVPGVCSSREGRDFGSFLGGLGKLGYGWSYRILDAQYIRVESHPYAVPQRRRRVFVVGHSGADWRSAAEVLLEPDGVRGNFAPRREARKGVARGPADGARGDSLTGYAITAGDQKRSDRRDWVYVNDLSISLPLDQTGSNPDRAQGSTLIGPHPAASFDWPEDVADPVLSVEGKTYTHEGTTFRMHNVVPDAVIGFQSNLGSQGGDVFEGISTVVRREAPPAVCVNMEHALHATGNANSVRLSDVCEALTRSEFKGHTAVLTPAVAFSCKDYGGDASVELAPTMRAMPDDGSHANGGGQLAVAFKASHFTRGKDGAPSEIVPPLSADADKGDQDTLVAAVAFDAYNQTATGGVTHPLRVGTGNGYGDEIPQVLTAAVSSGRGYWNESETGATLRSQESPNKADTLLAAPMAVRRLTPRECERLQGFPDDWTLITYRGKPAADGPRYKALGNSMAVNVMRFIGERIHRFETAKVAP